MILEGPLCLSLLIQVSPNFVVISIVNVNRRFIYFGSKGLDSPETTSINKIRICREHKPQLPYHVHLIKV